MMVDLLYTERFIPGECRSEGLNLAETFVPDFLEGSFAAGTDSILTTTSSFAHAKTVCSTRTVSDNSFVGEQVTGHSPVSVTTSFGKDERFVLVVNWLSHDGGYSHEQKSSKEVDLDHFG